MIHPVTKHPRVRRTAFHELDALRVETELGRTRSSRRPCERLKHIDAFVSGQFVSFGLRNK